MSGRLLDMLAGLSPRERRLLALMGGVVLPLGVGFGLLLPLHHSRLEAEAALADAAALNAWVAARASEAQSLAPTADTPPKQAEAIGLSGIEESLKTAKLRSALSSIGTESGGVIALRFDDVDFVRLATWLSSSHPEWGYDIESYRFEARDEPSRVSARIELRPS